MKVAESIADLNVTVTAVSTATPVAPGAGVAPVIAADCHCSQGYVTPLAMPQVAAKFQPLKLACCRIWISVRPVPPVEVVRPEVSVSQ